MGINALFNFNLEVNYVYFIDMWFMSEFYIKRSWWSFHQIPIEDQTLPIGTHNGHKKAKCHDLKTCHWKYMNGCVDCI